MRINRIDGISEKNRMFELVLPLLTSLVGGMTPITSRWSIEIWANKRTLKMQCWSVALPLAMRLSSCMARSQPSTRSRWNHLTSPTHLQNRSYRKRYFSFVNADHFGQARECSWNHHSLARSRKERAKHCSIHMQGERSSEAALHIPILTLHA